MQTQVLFEHPLNEKMRTWLRIEFLIQQLTVNLPIVDHAGALHFFRNVSELLDVFERGEVRLHAHYLQLASQFVSQEKP
ncbi:hypothetical protein BHF41_11405 [Escherichia coli]|nr:hypothetical protein BHF41_11405 [Escherichia coli]